MDRQEAQGARPPGFLRCMDSCCLSCPAGPREPAHGTDTVCDAQGNGACDTDEEAQAGREVGCEVPCRAPQSRDQRNHVPAKSNGKGGSAKHMPLAGTGFLRVGRARSTEAHGLGGGSRPPTCRDPRPGAPSILRLNPLWPEEMRPQSSCTKQPWASHLSPIKPLPSTDKVRGRCSSSLR